jgi:hypothetical protein
VGEVDKQALLPTPFVSEDLSRKPPNLTGPLRSLFQTHYDLALSCGYQSDSVAKAQWARRHEQEGMNEAIAYLGTSAGSHRRAEVRGHARFLETGLDKARNS